MIFRCLVHRKASLIRSTLSTWEPILYPELTLPPLDTKKSSDDLSEAQQKQQSPENVDNVPEIDVLTDDFTASVSSGGTLNEELDSSPQASSKYDSFVPPSNIHFPLESIQQAGRVPVILLSHFFNEHFLLPYWIQNHAPLFDAAVLVDYGSTDDSVSLHHYDKRRFSI
jgi:hypothetical protein